MPQKENDKRLHENFLHWTAAKITILLVIDLQSVSFALHCTLTCICIPESVCCLLHYTPFSLILHLLIHRVSSCFLFTLSVNLFQDETPASAKRTPPSPYQGRTKAAPCLPHACIRLAPSVHKVCSGSTSVSRSTCGKDAGLFYVDFAESDVVVPALKRRKSEQGAKKKR